MSGSGEFPQTGDLRAGPLPPGQRRTHDWAHGGDRLLFQQCAACHLTFYFERSFCPACGDASPVGFASAGQGTVHATTLVQRAPSDEFRAIVPYRIVLVDMTEGFRVMGHGERSLAIGDAVICRIETIAGRALPFFTASPSEVPHAQ
jgi:uncharacterized OB-fold protein